QAGQSRAHWGPSMGASLACHHPFRVRERPLTPGVTRASLGLPDDKLILVTAGARLHTEIGGDWAAAMRELVAGRSDVLWLMVGGDGCLPPALDGCDPAKLRLMPHRTDIQDLLRHSDIYVNPPRMGGGFSVVDAMAAGLPVAAFRGTDGGNKLG